MTVKEFIEQTEHNDYVGLNLETQHLSNLQNNEVVFVDGIPYVKTSIVFGGSQAPKTLNKITDLELENERLTIALDYLQVEYEAALIKIEALQNYARNGIADVQTQNQRQRKEIVTLQERIVKFKAALEQKNNEIK
jgi:hypothetical protein